MPKEEAAQEKKKEESHWTASPVYSVLFLVIFILAFFPQLFIGLLNLPLYVLPSSIRPRLSNDYHQPNLRAPPVSPCACTHLPPAGQTNSEHPQTTMSWFQKTINLSPRSRGSYLITDEVTAAIPEIKSYKVGILHLFVQHTSCALSMNENWDSDVREDMSDAMDRIVPEDKKGDMYRHSAEGSDDMPASVSQLASA
jgi:secondary thiamine-phosphate synthase enzyme